MSFVIYLLAKFIIDQIIFQQEQVLHGVSVNKTFEAPYNLGLVLCRDEDWRFPGWHWLLLRQLLWDIRRIFSKIVMSDLNISLHFCIDHYWHWNLISLIMLSVLTFLITWLWYLTLHSILMSYVWDVAPFRVKSFFFLDTHLMYRYILSISI